MKLHGMTAGQRLALAVTGNSTDWDVGGPDSILQAYLFGQVRGLPVSWWEVNHSNPAGRSCVGVFRLHMGSGGGHLGPAVWGWVVYRLHKEATYCGNGTLSRYCDWRRGRKVAAGVVMTRAGHMGGGQRDQALLAGRAAAKKAARAERAQEVTP